jgi:hypothetical protein
MLSGHERGQGHPVRPPRCGGGMSEEDAVRVAVEERHASRRGGPRIVGMPCRRSSRRRSSSSACSSYGR